MDTLGSKYIEGRDIKEVAKDVRRDIREAVLAGELPDVTYRVRIARQWLSLAVDAITICQVFATASEPQWGACLLQSILDSYNQMNANPKGPGDRVLAACVQVGYRKH